MRIGNLAGEIDQSIIDLGFPIVNEITILGFTLQNRGDMVAKNYEKVREKIFNIIRFWERFNLSLPGKISIYKTLLLPQINYIASVLTPSDEIIDELSQAMVKFVTRGFSIGKSRLYSPPAQGGLGLFDLKKFICALQCAWIKRANTCNDNWKVTIKGVNGSALDCHLLIKENYGIGIQNIIESYIKFREAFYSTGNNFQLEKIFRNSNFGYGRTMINKFDDEFFGAGLVADHGVELNSLTWKQLCVNNEFIRFDDFSLFAGFEIDNRRYNQLKNCFQNLLKRFGGGDEEPVSIETFFRKIKKGSKFFRKIIMNNSIKSNFYKTNQTVKSFCKSAGVPSENEEIWARSLGIWNTFCYPNRFKTFLFKYYSNILGTGNRVAHFNQNTDPACVFCVKTPNFPAPLESFAHLFFDCPETEKFLKTSSVNTLMVKLQERNFSTVILKALKGTVLRLT